MKATRSNLEYIKSLGGIFEKSKYVFGDVYKDSIEVFINRRDIYRKRNRKSCYIDHPGKWVPLPKEYIRRGVGYSEVMASSYFQQDDMMTTRRNVSYYIPKEFKAKLIEQFELI